MTGHRYGSDTGDHGRKTKDPTLKAEDHRLKTEDLCRRGIMGRDYRRKSEESYVFGLMSELRRKNWELGGFDFHEGE